MLGLVLEGRFTLKKYQVNVNGKQYVVEIQEMNGAAVNSTRTSPATTITEKPAAAPEFTADNTSNAEGHPVKAPLRGQILRVDIKPGDQVQLGQVILTIEALKLENEIVAPVSGTVTGVFVQQGSTAEVGDVLATIKEG